MKTSTKRGKASNKTLKSALEQIGEAHGPLFTLASFGEVSDKCQMDLRALMDGIRSITGEARLSYQNAAALLPKEHDARAHLGNAQAALNSLMEFASLVSEDATQNGESNSKEFRRAAGKIILAFVGESGRYMERAEKAIDPREVSIGYLSGYLLAGGGDMQQVIESESTLLNLFRRSNDEGKQQTLAFAKVTQEQRNRYPG